MTKEIKKFIEDNIDIIDNNNWDQLFKIAPHWMRGDLMVLCIKELNVDIFNYLTRLYPSMLDINTDNGSIDSVTIPFSVDILGSELFYQWRPSIKKLIIQHSLKVIPNQFFRGYKGEQIILPHCTNLEKIEIGAFMDCDNLKRIILPSSINKSKLYVNELDKDWLLGKIELK